MGTAERGSMDLSSDEDEVPELVQVQVQPVPTVQPVPVAVPAPEEAAPPEGPAVPVTIITGFLGSGKTTLLNHILTSDHGYRIAVIENEFGEQTGVEALVAKDGIGSDSSTLEGFYELSNGCICCSVKDDLVNTLEALLERRNKFDYIIIETTGVADPGALAQNFWLDSELESRLVLDGIVTLVDCKNAPRHLASGDSSASASECARQIALADRLIMNKRDLVSEEELAQVTDLVTGVNPIADIMLSERSKVELEQILKIQCFTPANNLRAVNAAGHGHGHGHGGNHLQQSGVMTFTLTELGAVDMSLLNQWLGSVLWDAADTGTDRSGSRNEDTNAAEIFRVKGVVAVSGSEAKHVVQAVHETFECTAVSEAWAVNEVRQSKLVVIGRKLEEEQMRNGFRSCIAK